MNRSDKVLAAVGIALGASWLVIALLAVLLTR